MTLSRTAIQDFSLSNKAYINAIVTFYAVVDGEKSTELATLYSTLTGDGELQNPQTLDSHGKFKQPIYIGESVIATVTGLGNTPDHDTGIINSPTGRQESQYYPSSAAITIDPSIFFHLIDTTSGNVVVTMPDPDDDLSIGETVVIKRNTSGANSLTINDIEGGNNVNLTGQNFYLMLYSNGSDWFIIAERRS